MGHFNWPLFTVLMVMVLPASALRIYLAATFDRRAAKRQKVAEQAEADLLSARRMAAAEEAEREGFTLCGRCRLRRVASYRGQDDTMCEWCGI